MLSSAFKRGNGRLGWGEKELSLSSDSLFCVHSFKEVYMKLMELLMLVQTHFLIGTYNKNMDLILTYFTGMHIKYPRSQYAMLTCILKVSRPYILALFRLVGTHRGSTILMNIHVSLLYQLCMELCGLLYRQTWAQSLVLPQATLV